MTPFKQAQRAQALYDDPQLPRRDLADMTARLESENDELRKLVREMYEFMSIAEKLNAHIKLAPSETCSFANRMRELGVRA